MTEQPDPKTPFLEQVMAQGHLSAASAQAATKVMFRILRDMMPHQESDAIAQALQKADAEAAHQAADLWADPNVVVALFSRINPLRPLTIGYQTVMLRLEEESGLPEGVKPERAALAIFSAIKRALPEASRQAIAACLPADGLRQMWERA